MKETIRAGPGLLVRGVQRKGLVRVSFHVRNVSPINADQMAKDSHGIGRHGVRAMQAYTDDDRELARWIRRTHGG